MNSLVISSIYSKNKVITTCPPKSLNPWLESNKTRKAIEKNENCLVNVQEVSMRRLDKFQKIIIEKVKGSISYF